MISVRVSSLPLLFACGQSMGGDIRVDESGGAGALGTATHKALESVVPGGSVDWESLPALAAEYGVDVDELRGLVAAGVAAWRDGGLTPAVPEVALSAVFGDVLLSGHLDWAAGAEGGDWKTGRNDSDYSQQMRGYAALLLADDRSIDAAKMSIIWLRDQQIESYTLRRADLPAWSDALNRAVNDKTFRTGPHCKWCHRSATCEGARARHLEAVRAIQTTGEATIDEMAPDAVIDLYNQASTVAALAKRVADAIKARALREPIDGEKRRLVVVEEQRREIDTLKAWPVLQEHLTTEAMASALDVRISRAEQAIRDAAPRGQAAKQIREFSAALESSGAVRFTSQQKIKEMRK